tara:strand:- start:202 stop:444 length:243 start_codon:yes stop_codon:yes gene_type:complete
MDQDLFVQYLDLRGTPCPLNFIRCTLAIENLQSEQSLKIHLDRGEAEESVISGLSKAGHDVQIINQNKDNITLIVHCFDS